MHECSLGSWEYTRLTLSLEQIHIQKFGEKEKGVTSEEE